MWNIDRDIEKGAIIQEDGMLMTYSELFKQQNKVKRKIKNRNLVFLISTQSMESIVIYVSCIQNKIPVMVIDSKLSLKVIVRLVEEYRPCYIWQHCQDYHHVNYVQIDVIHNFSLYYNRRNEKSYNINADLALMLLTSGSTGNAKSVCLSYENIQSNTEEIVEALRISNMDRAMVMLPICFSYGLSIINTYLYAGATLLLPKSNFSQKEFWEFFRVQNGTAICGVPYMYELLMKMGFHNLDMDSLKLMTQAGGKLSEKVQRYYLSYAEKRKVKLAIMYGQTEATARISIHFLDEHPDKINSVGKVLPGGKVNISDKNGEVIYRGTNVCMGYASSFQDLSANLQKREILHTGDIGYVDGDGFLFITGRLNRFAKVLGLRINMDDLQNEISKLCDSEVYCIEGEECIVICIDESLKERKIWYAIDSLAINKHIFRIYRACSFPRNEYGKVLYKSIEDQWRKKVENC